MTREQLVERIFTKQSYLCVGLDTDPEKIPAHLKSLPDGVLQFNKAIIDATRDKCVAYKINTAFYEAQGLKGWQIMSDTLDYIGNDHFTIADAKRGDIGNTSTQYARAFFEALSFDSITVAPYMGSDSVQPFLAYPEKWAIVLALTSNAGAADFERQPLLAGELYEKVLTTVSRWGTPSNLMFVVGATQSSAFENIRRLAPEHFYLVPGVGAQGGSLKDISETGMHRECGLLVNNSRAILYAGKDAHFADAARKLASEMQQEMQQYLKLYAR